MMRRLRSGESGFTLIELMISITIGLIVVSIASSALQQAIRGNLRIKDTAMMQESVYFTSHMVEQHLRQTGYKPVNNSLITGRRIPIPRNDEVFPEVGGEWLEGHYLKADTDSISVRFQGSSNNAGEVDGSIIDCGGNAIDADTVTDVSISIVDQKLVCTSNGVQYVIVGGENSVSVDELLISLGIDEGDNGSIDRYVDSSVATTAEMADTREILLRILLVSHRNLDAITRTYKFNNSEIDYPDNRYRREVIIRTVIRNVADFS